ncbi:6576_t:CDS:2 [Paraglomus occultum]|uniref:sn-1-specific diacylglycerol lipase n=1 Tax=Paraglomus occultum TaxID=144539 RepID=A0A9N9EWR9_9GLOM|nr:6576_t:CDS:2 [Paraglomus occultum]
MAINEDYPRKDSDETDKDLLQTEQTYDSAPTGATFSLSASTGICLPSIAVNDIDWERHASDRYYYPRQRISHGRRNEKLIGEKVGETLEHGKEDDEASPNTVSALIHQPHSQLAVKISSITNASRAGLDLAGIITKFTLDTMKLSTKTSLSIAKAVTGVVSNAMIQATQDGMGRLFLPRLIDASTDLLHRTLSLTEQIALAGLEITSETVQYTLSTVSDSTSLIDTLFGTTDAAKALAEFVALVRREWVVREEEFDDCEAIGTLGVFQIIKALAAWASLQCITSQRWESEMTGWKKVKLVDLRDVLEEWEEINHSDSLYDGLEWLEDEEDEEMVLVQAKTDNLVVGELTRDEKQGMPRWSAPVDVYSPRLNSLFAETTKRFSNPYLEEYVNQPEEEKLFTLLRNLKRYSKFSSTAYDFKTAIINKLPYKAAIWRENGRLQRYTFARVNDLPLHSIVHTSHQVQSTNNSHYKPTYILFKDHDTKSIILALRGTMSIHDLIVDLSCEYMDFQLPEDIQRGDETKYKVHKGIWQVAKDLSTPGAEGGVFDVLNKELEENEDYGLVLIGHSLGAGVASVLALLWASPTTRMTTRWSKLPLGRRVHCYAFATPCVMSAELSKRSKTLTTSVAYANDFIPRLSLGHVQDLRDMVCYMGSKIDPETNKDLMSTILSKVIEYKSKQFSGDDENEKEAAKKEIEEYFWNIRSKVHSIMSCPKLYPAGKLKDNDKKYNMLEIEDVEKMFEEIWFSPHMITDHLPMTYDYWPKTNIHSSTKPPRSLSLQTMKSILVILVLALLSLGISQSTPVLESRSGFRGGWWTGKTENNINCDDTGTKLKRPWGHLGCAVDVIELD